MAKLNLSQASKLVGKNRTTLWRHISSGRLSAENDRNGKPLVDTSELLRVYGEFEKNATPQKEEMQHHATPSYEELLTLIKELKKEQEEMKSMLQNFQNRLEHKPEENLRPEDDPQWPREVNSFADIALRNEIKAKYQSHSKK